MNFVKFLRALFLQKNSGRLLLMLASEKKNACKSLKSSLYLLSLNELFTHSSKNNIRGKFFGKRKFLVLFCRKWVLFCTQIHYAILDCEVTGGGRNLGFQWLFIGRELFKDWFKNDTTHFIGLSSAQELALSNFHIKVACLNFPPW